MGVVTATVHAHYLVSDQPLHNSRYILVVSIACNNTPGQRPRHRQTLTHPPPRTVTQPSVGTLPPGVQQTALRDGSAVAGPSCQVRHTLSSQRADQGRIFLFAAKKTKQNTILLLGGDGHLSPYLDSPSPSWPLSPDPQAYTFLKEERARKCLLLGWWASWTISTSSGNFKRLGERRRRSLSHREDLDGFHF